MLFRSQNKYKEKEHPTIEALDAVAPEHPVQCMRICGHLGVYNTKAFELANITGPEDAKRFSDHQLVVKDGKLTGMAKDNTNFYLWSLIQYTEEEKWDALMRSHSKLLKNGITSIHIPGETSDVGYPMIRRAVKNKDFLVRCYGFNGRFDPDTITSIVENNWVTGVGDTRFRFGACKIMLDGPFGIFPISFI